MGDIACLLEQQLQACKGELVKLRQQKKHVAQRLRSIVKAQQRQRLRAMTVAFILFVPTAPEHKFDLEYLRRQWSGKLNIDASSASTELETKFLEAPLKEVWDISEGRCEGIPQSFFDEAIRFRREAETYNWVCAQNAVQGLAPSSTLVMQYRRRSTAIAELKPDSASMWLSYKAGERKWVQRFRTRWGLSLGRIPAGEVVPLNALREKDFRSGK
jgi:hypothetical protein